VPAIGGAAQVETVKMRQRQYRFGVAILVIDRRQHHRLRLKARTPERRLPVMRRVGIAREIASPSDARMLQARGHSAARSARWFGNPDDNRRSDADTPRQSRRPEFVSCACMPPATASRCSAWRHLPKPGRAGQHPDKGHSKIGRSNRSRSKQIC